MEVYPASESAQFELHFIDCEQCLDLIEESRDFHAALRLSIPSKANSMSHNIPLWLSQSRYRVSLAFIFSIFILTQMSISILLVKQNMRLRNELEAAKKSTALEMQPSANKRGDEESTEATELTNLGMVEQNRQRVMNPNSLRKPMSTEQSFQFHIPIFVLTEVSGIKQVSNEIVINRTHQSFALSIPVETATAYKGYRATILTSSAKLIWRSNNLHLDRYGALTLGFESSFFQGGDYLVRLEGISKDGSLSTIATYPVRFFKNS